MLRVGWGFGSTGGAASNRRSPQAQNFFRAKNFDFVERLFKNNQTFHSSWTRPKNQLVEAREKAPGASLNHKPPRRAFQRSSFAPPRPLLASEFPELRKRYWGPHFWARGYFCTTSSNITDDVILQYIRSHEPTGASQ
jgi:REP element-mobilizing transposase RayT